MKSTQSLKEEFLSQKELLFSQNNKQIDALKFSREYSLLVEEFIAKIAGKKKYNFALTSAGSFSRRELAPFSDIDLIFISESVQTDKEDIIQLVTKFWDCGIEASHTVRDFSDIDKYLNEDLHTFTQFFETRFLLGNDKIYSSWNKILFDIISPDIKIKLLKEFFEDFKNRYKKYGDSPKVLEPNIKLSAGGLRDFQMIEWIYILKNKVFLNKQNESSQAENFISILKNDKLTSSAECKRLFQSYKILMRVRNLLHLSHKQKCDRFEFSDQQLISEIITGNKNSVMDFMKDYFTASNVIYRFSKSMIKKFKDDISSPLPDSLAIELDEDFILKGKTIFFISDKELNLSDILRGFYYRGLHSAHFDESLRSKIIDRIENNNSSIDAQIISSTFFREIMRLPKNVGITLAVMNELGVLKAFLPEFSDLIGFFQAGVYHCYAADEHTIITIQNLENLQEDKSPLGRIYNKIKNKDLLYLALLFHDIAKPINISGHEILGAETASSVMHRLGYSEEEIEHVSFLVKHHLVMEQTAFRRNLNDPGTLNNFANIFSSLADLDMLYLITYADLSAVNPAVWTSWKSDLLYELYSKTHSMIKDKITGEELLYSTTYIVPKNITKFSSKISEVNVKEHIDSIDDIAYAHQFTDEEIALHIEEIQKGQKISVLFNETQDFTNVTVITFDFPSLLSKLCGVLSINDANIHDAKIFTRKDGIVIDSFNVTDFRTNRVIDRSRYEKIKTDFHSVISGILELRSELEKLKSKWWRIENKFFKRSGKININFEQHEKYTIIDIFSPDRLGFLYQVTSKLNELGLFIYFAKISTKGDDIADAFYVLDREGRKISENDYNFIKEELTKTIKKLL